MTDRSINNYELMIVVVMITMVYRWYILMVIKMVMIEEKDDHDNGVLM